MEENSSLFSLLIDPVTKDHLTEAAKWARFLAIVGFVFLAFTILFGLYISVTLTSYGMMGDNTGLMGAAGAGVAIMYIIFAVIAFFPLLYTFRFARQIRGALSSNDQALLNSSFENLKACYRYLGIMTVIFLVLMALSLLFGIAGLALS